MIREVLRSLALLWCVATASFALVELAPGDACSDYLPERLTAEELAAYRAARRCDDPALVRYGALMGRLVVFDLGVSETKHRPVADAIADAAPVTLWLGALSLAWSVPLAVVVGTAQATRRGTMADAAATAGQGVVGSMPEFVVGIALLRATGAHVGLPLDPTPLDWLRQLTLPALALGLPVAASFARYARVAVLEVLPADFVRTARAKGLAEARVIARHVLPNAGGVLLVRLGLYLPLLASGAVVVERVFALPGAGSLLLDGIRGQDTALVVGCTWVVCLAVVAANRAADLVVGWADPRARDVE